MKNKVILALLCCCLTLQAGINSTAQWNIGPSGSDTNGCSYDSSVASPGTDTTNQDASAFNGTDLASTNGTTNPCVVTSASHNFVASDNGVGINITAGTSWTAGHYTIVSTSGNAATLDGACGSAASLSGGTWHEGGRCQTIAHVLSTAVMNTALGRATAGTTAVPVVVNLKSGTYTFTTQDTWTNLSAIEITVRGYGTTPGDYGTPPTITTATNSTILFKPAGSMTAMVFDNVTMTNTAVTRADCIQWTGNTGGTVMALNSTFDGCNIGVNGNTGNVGLLNTEIKNSISFGAQANSAIRVGPGTWIHANGGTGANVTGNASAFYCSGGILSGNTGSGASIAGGSATTINSENCDYASNTVDGIRFSWATTGNQNNIQNFQFNCNIFDNNTGWGINNTNTATKYQIIGKDNAFRANGSGTFTNVQGAQGDLAPSVSPFKSATDFGLNGTATGGPVLKKACNVGTLGGFTVYDVGAVQTTAGTAGGGGTFGYVAQ